MFHARRGRYSTLHHGRFRPRTSVPRRPFPRTTGRPRRPKQLGKLRLDCNFDAAQSCFVRCAQPYELDARTFTSMSLFFSTYGSRLAAPIVKQLADLPFRDAAHVLLFSISPAPGLPQDELSELVHVLSSHPNSIGCLSAPARIGHNSVVGSNAPFETVCSVAVFDGDMVTPFRSTIPGKEPTQVGRWHAFRKRDAVSARMELPQASSGIDWESVWAKRTTPALPPELQTLRCAQYIRVRPHEH